LLNFSSEILIYHEQLQYMMFS